MDMRNNTAFDCHQCNSAGTESCQSINPSCRCKLWYTGDLCQYCRFPNEFVLAPNGSCIPCPCVDRPTHECLQSKLCINQTPLAFTHARAASVLFVATLAALILIGSYLIWRIAKRTRRFKVVKIHDHEADQYGSETHSSALDEDIWKDDERLMHNSMTPTSERSTVTSLFYIPNPSPAGTSLGGSKSVYSFLSNLNKKDKKKKASKSNAISTPSVLNVDNARNLDNLDEDVYPKRNMKISSSCLEYYFLSVQTNADEVSDEEHEI